MARSCDTCAFYRKEYDEFRQSYDDVVIIGYKGPENHFCPMYDDHIPHRIWNDGGECEFHEQKTP